MLTRRSRKEEKMKTTQALSEVGDEEKNTEMGREDKDIK